MSAAADRYAIDMEALRRNHDVQVLINSLMELSFREDSLDNLLSQSLDLILSLPWLSFESRGSVFVVEDEPGVLVMKGVKGLAESRLNECARIPFGRCLCGKAAQEKELQFCDTTGKDYEIAYEGMLPHGHYCVPIKSDRELLGVLNIYLREGYRRDSSDEEFLTTIANTLAGVIKRKRLEEELRQLATIDRLTGAYNRRKFDDIIAHEMERAARYQHLLSVIMFDIDNFKAVNDTYGHIAGDSVLSALADVVRKRKRAVDHFIRWGGEEFMIIAPGTGAEGAVVLAERVRKTIEDHVFDIVGKITVSLGVTQFRHGDTAHSLIKRTDDALYKAKRSGRNQFSVL